MNRNLSRSTAALLSIKKTGSFFSNKRMSLKKCAHLDSVGKILPAHRYFSHYENCPNSYRYEYFPNWDMFDEATCCLFQLIRELS